MKKEPVVRSDSDTKYFGKEMNMEQQKTFDGIHATVVMARMVYEASIAEGFTPGDALGIAMNYITTIIQAGMGKMG